MYLLVVSSIIDCPEGLFIIIYCMVLLTRSLFRGMMQVDFGTSESVFTTKGGEK